MTTRIFLVAVAVAFAVDGDLVVAVAIAVAVAFAFDVVAVAVAFSFFFSSPFLDSLMEVTNVHHMLSGVRMECEKEGARKRRRRAGRHSLVLWVFPDPGARERGFNSLRRVTPVRGHVSGRRIVVWISRRFRRESFPPEMTLLPDKEFAGVVGLPTTLEADLFFVLEMGTILAILGIWRGDGS
jgi:hypothetical protein